MERQPTEKQLASLKAQAERIIARYPDEIAQINADLLNFDIPAQRSINAGFARMETARFTAAGDCVWEMICALVGGSDGPWTYSRPARHLIQRWAGY